MLIGSRERFIIAGPVRSLMDRIEYVYTFGMDEAEIERRLDANDTGVLALAAKSSAYAVPVAYTYDDGSLYVRLADDGTSTKMEYVESTTDACLCLYSVGSDDDAWSILLTGSLRKLTGSDRDAFDATAINESFHPLYVFDQDVDAIDLELYELDFETVTGRKTGQ